MYLSVIIPAYNEAKRIGSTLQTVCSWLATQSYDWEVVVVDNRSTDATADVVRGVMQQFHAIRLIQEKRPGKGYAVTAGMLFGTGEIRLLTTGHDGDGSSLRPGAVGNGSKNNNKVTIASSTQAMTKSQRKRMT